MGNVPHHQKKWNAEQSGQNQQIPGRCLHDLSQKYRETQNGKRRFSPTTVTVPASSAHPLACAKIFRFHLRANPSQSSASVIRREAQTCHPSSFLVTESVGSSLSNKRHFRVADKRGPRHSTQRFPSFFALRKSRTACGSSIEANCSASGFFSQKFRRQFCQWNRPSSNKAVLFAVVDAHIELPGGLHGDEPSHWNHLQTHDVEPVTAYDMNPLPETDKNVGERSATVFDCFLKRA